MTVSAAWISVTRIRMAALVTGERPAEKIPSSIELLPTKDLIVRKRTRRGRCLEREALISP